MKGIIMVLNRILAPFRANQSNLPVLDALYSTIMTQSRAPHFYAVLQVPDTVDGRFDMLVMHTYLVVARLRDGGDATAELSQELFDHMFRDMDHALREMGVGDMGIGKRIQKMASKFYGRGEAYDEALSQPGDTALHDAIGRNVFAGIEPPADAVSKLAAYLRAAQASLHAQSLEAISKGDVTFPEVAAHG
ncbi:MAG: ubiquinol-cytochrome C chaperone family protein [Candidatus Phaeomarinobacter sp.]